MPTKYHWSLIELKTGNLFLDRYLGLARPQHYVAWAVELLVEGRDTPSLWVLAGELPSEWQDIEDYFLSTCKELNLKSLDPSDSPRDAVPLVKQAYQSERLSPKETLRIMSSFYERSDYSDPLLSLWFGVADEFYPEPMGFLKEWIDREWELFDLAFDLDIPEEFYRFCRCENCLHIGPPPKASFYMDYRVMQDQAPLEWNPATCKRCGSTQLKHMGFSDVHEDYFSRLREAAS
jgi:hypothetical protein